MNFNPVEPWYAIAVGVVVVVMLIALMLVDGGRRK